MIYWTLIIEFLKTGLFSIGGGLATLPFLYQMAEKYPWFTTEELINMIAISESTPGPIGINMATYAGFVAAGILGAILASLAIATPSVCISVIAARGFEKFKDNKYVQDAFYSIRPVVAGLIAVAGIGIMKTALLDLPLFATSGKLSDLFRPLPILLFVIFFYLTNKYKKHPIFYLAIAGVLGVLLKL